MFRTFYISTFQSMCAVPNVAIFCSSLILCFPSILLKVLSEWVWDIIIIITPNNFYIWHCLFVETLLKCCNSWTYILWKWVLVLLWNIIFIFKVHISCTWNVILIYKYVQWNSMSLSYPCVIFIISLTFLRFTSFLASHTRMLLRGLHKYFEWQGVLWLNNTGKYCSIVIN